ncbi:MAG: CinA family protein [Halodesulfurarchaeum sp.]
MDGSGADPVEERIGVLLDEAGDTLATVESCTGGLVGSLVTDVPGSSAYYDRGYVTYSNRAKLDLGVSREAIDEHGAVSELVARDMARAARDAAGTTWAVSTTGIAGPSGGTPEKPVGTVFVGVARAGEWGSGDTDSWVTRRNYEGTRTEIKHRIARGALQHLLEVIEDRN